MELFRSGGSISLSPRETFKKHPKMLPQPRGLKFNYISHNT